MIEQTIKGVTVTAEDDERQPCEVWTRVMGYYRPVSEFNIGKRSEHEERVSFNERTIIQRMIDSI